jgi:hypothetical protein
MTTRRLLLLLASHSAVAAAGFAAGIYALPILISPPVPSAEELKAAASDVQFTGTFRRDLKDSDALHWGEGVVSIAPKAISLAGRLAPGPDYKLYLVPTFVDDEASFLTVKDRSLRVGDIKTFDGFIIDVPEGTDISAYDTVLVWCEAFGEFISAAKYR